MGWSRPHLSMENPEAEIVFPFAGTPVGARQFSNVMIDSGKWPQQKLLAGNCGRMLLTHDCHFAWGCFSVLYLLPNPTLGN